MTGSFGSNFPDIVDCAVIRRLNIGLKVSKEPTRSKRCDITSPRSRMANGGVVRSDKIVYYIASYIRR